MTPTHRQLADDEDDLLAALTDIAYRALLRQGLRRPFVDVELELWGEIRRMLGGSPQSVIAARL